MGGGGELELRLNSTWLKLGLGLSLAKFKCKIKKKYVFKPSQTFSLTKLLPHVFFITEMLANNYNFCGHQYLKDMNMSNIKCFRTHFPNE